MGPRDLRIIWMDWGQLTMVTKDGGYYPPPPPLQRIPRFNPRIPLVPHDIKHVSGLHNLTLGVGGGDDGGEIRGTWHIGAGPCSVFINGKWTSCADPAGEVAEVF